MIKPRDPQLRVSGLLVCCQPPGGVSDKRTLRPRSAKDQAEGQQLQAEKSKEVRH